VTASPAAEDATLSNSATVLKQALEALDANRPADAVQQLRLQLSQDPGNPLVMAMLGVAFTRTGELDEAVEALDRAHYLEPDNPQILVDYGNALLAAGRDQSARSRFEGALRLDPTHQGALRSLSELYQQLATRTPPSAQAPATPRPAARPTPALPESTPPPRPSALDSRSTGPGSALPDLGRPGLERSPRAPIEFSNVPGEPQDHSRWDPEPLPSFGSLARATLQLWGQQPLIWLLMLAVPNAVAAALMPSAWELRWVAVLCWTAALGIGVGPVLLAMSNQWIFGRLQGGASQPIGSSVAHGTILSLLYALLVVGPFGIALTQRSPLPPPIILLAVLLSTAPFHALLSPALVLSATDGPPGWPALQRAWLLAGKRSWLHLGLLVGVGLAVGSVLGVLAWAFAVTLRAQGDTVLRVLEVAGLSLGESLWIALITITGLDAISAAEMANRE
jgi:hypothetical protein